MNQIFLSYSHEDSDFAEILYDKLTQAKFTVWKDTDIHGGEDWRSEIDHAIKEAFALIVTMTPEAKTSEYVTYEWAFAWGAGVKVIPVLLKKTELHPRLESLQHLDFTNRDARPWDKLIELLREGESSKPPAAQAAQLVHGYSGQWEVKSVFSRWRDYPLEPNDTVYFEGTTFLLLSVDGKKGYGTQKGKLYVSIDNYKATFEIANRVNRAYITEDGILHMDVEVLSRKRIKEEGEPREARFREELFGSGKFYIDLKPVPGESKRLEGIHMYPPGDRVIQKAKENFNYLGFWSGEASQ